MTEAGSVAVYGATGFTGRLVVHALAARQVPLRLVGRDASRLKALAEELPAGTTWAVAPATDEATLRRALGATRVVVSCAGPFSQTGCTVLDAAIADGRHYLDISGEIGFARELVARDARARATGSAIIGCVGFDVVVSDAAAVLACEALGGEPVRSVRLTVASTTQPSRGSLRTLLAGLQSGDYAWTFAGGVLVPRPVAAERWAVRLPAPFQACAAVEFGLVELVVSPRSTATPRLQTGLAVPHARVVAWGVRALVWLSTLPGLRAALRLVLAGAVRLVPEGGGPGARAAARFAVEARATAASGNERVVIVTGGDVGEVTATAAAICVERAMRSAELQGGFQTPSQAFGARWLLDRLAASGVVVHTEGPSTTCTGHPPEPDPEPGGGGGPESVARRGLW